MSSHHIIREDQEPALVMDGVSGADHESIQQLLEWSPTVVVTDRALKNILLWGIKIDVVVAVNTRIEELKVVLHDQLPVKIISANRKSEELETALMFLTASKQKAVNVVTDAALESFEKFYALDVAVIQEGKRWVFIRSGRFEKWLPAGTHITVYPGQAHPTLITEQDGIFTLHREYGFWICETI